MYKKKPDPKKSIEDIDWNRFYNPLVPDAPPSKPKFSPPNYLAQLRREREKKGPRYNNQNLGRYSVNELNERIRKLDQSLKNKEQKLKLNGATIPDFIEVNDLLVKTVETRLGVLKK